MVQEEKFIHKVSKGSRFNQIYIPLGMNGIFEIGDIVEIKLLRKKVSFYYSKNLKKLSNYKENLAKELFSFLSGFKEIKQAFIVGSFLTSKIDYNDIDILLISDKNIENEVYQSLIEKFNIKFHVITIPAHRFEYLIYSCPLTRSMLSYFVSNKEFILPSQNKLDINHIRFLLMTPEDLLEVNLGSRAYYDSIRRLITIESFLENKPVDILKINNQLTKITGESLFSLIKNNEIIENGQIKFLREIIKRKLDLIKNKLNKLK
ncbi:MAG: hypothetical protein AABW91_04080 [Nanoarchaeota archaeon]